MGKKGKKLDPKQVDQRMELYSESTTAALLDGAFGATDHPSSGHMAERGDHIIIDGRTARELLVEEFSKTHDPGGVKFDVEFHKFYTKEGRNLINQRVTAALMTGKRVEVFVPDPKTGRIQKEPSRLTATGYTPDPLKKPAQMTRWQKFWSKIGFYKDKVAEHQNYKRQMEARDRVQFYNRATRVNSMTLSSEIPSISEAWGKEYPERKGINIYEMDSKGKYRLSRQGMPAYVNTVLALKKDKNDKYLYTNEQLFDMSDPAMQKARADAAEEIYLHNLRNDTDWLVTLQHDSKTALSERINEQGKKLDFSRPDVTEQEGYREFTQLSNTAFEISQEISQTRDELNKKYGPGEHEEISFTLGELPNAAKLINASLNSQRNLMSGATGTGGKVRTALADVLAGRAAQQHFANMQKDPDVPVSEYAKGKVMDALSGINSDAKLDDEDIVGEKPTVTRQAGELEEEYLADPKNISRQIATGVFEQRIQLKGISTGGNEPDPVKLEILDADAAEQKLRDAAAEREIGNTSIAERILQAKIRAQLADDGEAERMAQASEERALKMGDDQMLR